MTESNKSYRRASLNSIIAIIMAGIAICTAGYLVYTIHRLDTAYSDVTRDLPRSRAELEGIENRISNFQMQLQDIQSRQNEKGEAIKGLDEKISDREAKLALILASETDAKQRLQRIAQETADADEERAVAKMTIAEAERRTAEIASMRNTERDLRNSLEKLEDRKVELSENVAGAESDRDGLNEKINGLKSTERDLQASVSDLRDETERLKDEKVTLAGIIEARRQAENVVQDLKDDQLDLETKNSQAEEQLVELAARIDAATQRLDDLGRQVSDFNSEREGLISSLEDARTQLIQARDAEAAASARESAADAAAKDAEARKIEAEAKLDFLKPDIKALLDDKAEALQTIANAQSDLDILQGSLAERRRLVADISTLKKEAILVSQELEDAKADIERVEGQLEQAQSVYMDSVRKAGAAKEELESLNRDVTTAQATLQSVLMEREAVKLERDRLDERVNELTEKGEAAAADEAAQKILIVELKREITQTRADVQALFLQKADLRSQIEGLDDNIARARQQREEVLSDLPSADTVTPTADIGQSEAPKLSQPDHGEN